MATQILHRIYLLLAFILIQTSNYLVECVEDIDIEIEEFNDVTEVPVSSTTRQQSSGDLTTTDTIIIGVTCGVAGIVLLGAIVYGCAKNKQMKKEREQMYQKYLQYDARAGATGSALASSPSRGGGASAGVQNAAFSADL